MAPHKSKGRKKLLSSTRPATVTSKPALSSRTTRSIIRSHHTLHKQLAQAQRSGDSALVASLQARLDSAGGLATYQQASTQGQAALRGGDSSKVLVEWFREVLNANEPTIADRSRMRLLEVGALRIDNACARSGLFDLTRIDLRSNHPDIAEQDFMERSPPTDDTVAFDVVSLSLVLNYVSDPAARGAMLDRVQLFLRTTITHDLLPGLFLVLPAPCVRNSRYLDEQRLIAILAALGYEVLRKKYSDKLAYFYCKYVASSTGGRFAKREILSGADRNNFAIILK